MSGKENLIILHIEKNKYFNSIFLLIFIIYQINIIFIYTNIIFKFLRF